MKIPMPAWLATGLIERALRTPYFHLYHADGSLYMARYWLRRHAAGSSAWAARVHYLATPDEDRHLHDHPWDFVSIVLRGGVEGDPAARRRARVRRRRGAHIPRRSASWIGCGSTLDGPASHRVRAARHMDALHHRAEAPVVGLLYRVRQGALARLRESAQ